MLFHQRLVWRIIQAVRKSRKRKEQGEKLEQ
jgi:hypothetical protein